mmetsp:Transcript_2718/g.10590  ORF Transcript_2718/g.10590 Transcript_2718/m.10590 type:complete len:319 (-) Transcript_2718:383-1339(-)
MHHLEAQGMQQTHRCHWAGMLLRCRQQLDLARALGTADRQHAIAPVLQAEAPEVDGAAVREARHWGAQAAPHHPAMLPMFSVQEVHDPHVAVSAAHAEHVGAVGAHGGDVAAQAAEPPLHLWGALAKSPQNNKAVHASRDDMIVTDRTNAKNRPQVHDRCFVRLLLGRLPGKELAARPTVQNGLLGHGMHGDPGPAVGLVVVARGPGDALAGRLRAAGCCRVQAPELHRLVLAGAGQKRAGDAGPGQRLHGGLVPQALRHGPRRHIHNAYQPALIADSEFATTRGRSGQAQCALAHRHQLQATSAEGLRPAAVLWQWP